MGKATSEVNVKNIEGTKQIVSENRQTKSLSEKKNEAVCIYFETQEEN